MENDLKFTGVTPAIINFNGNTEDIYAPVRTVSCDVNIVSDKILDDLYTPKKDEVCMKVEKTTSEVRRVQAHDQGTVGWTTKENYTINVYLSGDETSTTVWVDNITYKFTDIDGDLNMLCNLSGPSIGFRTDVWVKARRTVTSPEEVGDVFDEVNKWSLATNEKYFWVGSDSYKVIFDNSFNDLAKWNGTSWTLIGPYYRYLADGTRNGICTYDPVNVVHYENGTTELVYVLAYEFYVTESEGGWKVSESYQYQGDDIYFYGEYARKTRVFEDGEVKTIDVIPGSSAYSTQLFEIIPQSHVAYDLVELPSGVSYSTVLNDSDNNLFVWSTSGYMYWLEDYDWIQINVVNRGLFEPDTFYMKYQVGDVFVGIGDFSNGHAGEGTYKLLISWNPRPRIYYDSETVYTTTTIFDGYKMPNTYSQPVTQNLDQITMTAIDPVSILKYVTIDKLVEKDSTLTYGEIICKALAYVMLTSKVLLVERTVSYGGNYSGTNGILNLKCQMANFWNEGGKPSTAYDVIAELLKPFCMALVFNGEVYNIYNTNKTSGIRFFDKYNVAADGSYTTAGTSTEATVVYNFEYGDWKSNNTSEASIEIGSTYDKITGVANTMIPTYSKMVYDVVDYNQKALYDILGLNVQRNKTKGYTVNGNTIAIDTDDYWYYIWNGVYTNEIYNLESHGGYVNGYLNMNKAYTYLTGNAGHPSDYGAILNFYGGADNFTATGKEQTREKTVDVKKRITAYAEDNGTPLEFLENSDLVWTFASGYDYIEGTTDPSTTKSSSSSAKFGSHKQMGTSNRVVYHQEFPMSLSSGSENYLNLGLTQSYSRTGIDTKIDIMQNNSSTSNQFYLNNMDEHAKWTPHIDTSTINYFPAPWNASKVVVNPKTSNYFNRFISNPTSVSTQPKRPMPVWDRRRIDMYVQLSDNSVLQFNGNDWVSASGASAANSFNLVNMLNGKKLYHTDMKYRFIETPDYNPANDDYFANNRVSELNQDVPGKYSLTDEAYTHYMDRFGGTTPTNGVGAYRKTYKVYYDLNEDRSKWIHKSDEGTLSIILPQIDDISAKVIVDVYNSTILGMTGNSNTTMSDFETVRYEISGTGRYYDDDQGAWVNIPLTSGNCQGYGLIGGMNSVPFTFIPPNTTYVKAEHLDLSIDATVPQSNLGQMFSESDIKYAIEKNNDYLEEYDGPSFQVNTYNNLVTSSFSYIIFGSSLADGDAFILNGVSARPECYTIQAYMNWLSVIRKIYNKTLVPKPTSFRFSNIRTFLTSPEVGNNKLMVISDSWDVKTSRHTVSAIECQDLDVSDVETAAVIEVPRQARDERYRYTSAKK